MPRRRPVSHFLEGLIGALLFHRSHSRQRLTERLRQEAVALGDLPVIADDLWIQKRARLRQLLLERDPSDFLRWDVIRTTMVKRGRAPVVHELRHLRRRPDWSARWRPALRESTIGRPRPFHLYPRSSGNLIHQAYHLCRFEEATGLALSTVPLIVEFGGGYGRMCGLLHRLGFSGTYVIFDLPEVSVLQRFFLRHLDIPVLDAGAVAAAGGPARGVVTTSEVPELRTLLRSRPPGHAALIAMWSLSETPVELRAHILAEVSSFDAFLIGYTNRFVDLDNRTLFATWRSTLPNHTWYEFPIPHLRKAECYVFGIKK